MAAERIDGRLRLVVEDDGVGLRRGSSAKAGHGVGLGALRIRLAHLYGPNQMIELAPRNPTGARVTVELRIHIQPCLANGVRAFCL